MSVVPDSIEPVIGWRGWRLRGDVLHSCHYGGVWTPGEEHEAVCNKAPETKSAWVVMQRAAAVESGDPLAREWKPMPRSDDYEEDESYENGVRVPRPPRVALPDDLEYAYQNVPYVPHPAPAADCVCGIYAAATPEQAIEYPISVLGRVAMWGDVVPGAKGYRARYAYPLELFVLDKKPEPQTSRLSMWMFTFASSEESFPPRAGIETVLSEQYGVRAERVKVWHDALSLVAA